MADNSHISAGTTVLIGEKNISSSDTKQREQQRTTARWFSKPSLQGPIGWVSAARSRRAKGPAILVKPDLFQSLHSRTEKIEFEKNAQAVDVPSRQACIIEIASSLSSISLSIDFPSC